MIGYHSQPYRSFNHGHVAFVLFAAVIVFGFGFFLGGASNREELHLLKQIISGHISSQHKPCELFADSTTNEHKLKPREFNEPSKPQQQIY